MVLTTRILQREVLIGWKGTQCPTLSRMITELDSEYQLL